LRCRLMGAPCSGRPRSLPWATSLATGRCSRSLTSWGWSPL
jgi:hypothetical protein